jgi:hypothetical protein
VSDKVNKVGNTAPDIQERIVLPGGIVKGPDDELQLPLL